MSVCSRCEQVGLIMYINRNPFVQMHNPIVIFIFGDLAAQVNILQAFYRLFTEFLKIDIFTLPKP